MKLRELLEEFKEAIKVGNVYYEIFSNPTKKEIEELTKEQSAVRFIIDFKKKKLYVFKAEGLHLPASKILKIPYDYREVDKGNYYFGDGVYNGDGTKIDTDFYWSHQGKDINIDIKKHVRKKENSWLRKYFAT